MLTNREINELIRDRETWKRAASQSSHCGGNVPPPLACRVPWSMLRRCSGDHAHAARFATSLRSVSPGRLSSPSDGFFRERWCNSTVTKNPPKDPLFQLFEKNIQQRGYGAVREMLAAKRRQKHHHDAACTEQNPRDVIILHARRLIAMEAQGRKGILRLEREQWSALTSLYSQASFELLMEVEYVQRKAIFQAAIRGCRALLEEESVEFQCTNKLSHSAYKRYVTLHAREGAARNLIVHEEEQERALIEKLFYLFQMRSTGRNRLPLTRLENQILQRILKRIKPL